MKKIEILTAIPILALLPQIAMSAGYCGAEGQPVCTSNDGQYNILYSTGPLQTSTNQICDKGLTVNLDPATSTLICVGTFHFGRYQFDINSLSPWTRFIMADKSFGSQVDTPVNWNSTFGTHDSFSNSVDGSYSFIDRDQQLSISDQLIAGARTIRMDPITYGVTSVSLSGIQNDDELRMCHQSSAGGGTIVCNFDSYGRLFSYGLWEVNHWLQANPGEVLTIRMYRLQQDDVQHITDLVQNILGSQVLTPACQPIPALGFCPSNAGNWDPAANGWPTLRQMQAMNKRVIFFGDIPTPISYNWNDWVLADAYTDDPGDFNARYCKTTAGQDVRQRGYSQWGYIGEDRSLSNTFGSVPGQGLMDPAAVNVAASCGFSMIAVDFFEAGPSAPNASITVPGTIPIIGGDTIGDNYTFPAPDTRYANSVWNWSHAEDGSTGDTGDGGPAYIDSFGIWRSQPASFQLPFACAMNLVTFFAPVVTQWQITSAPGTWDKGYAACQAIGGKFRAPASPVESQYVTVAMTQYFAQGGSNCCAWINYKKTPTVNITPSICPPTADGSCPIAATITQGQVPATGLSLSFMGGSGGALFYAVPSTAGSTAMLTPRLNGSGALDIDYVGRTLAFDFTPTVASLTPGVYVDSITINETNGQTLAVTQKSLPFTLTVLGTSEIVSVIGNINGQSISADGAAPVTLPHSFDWHAGEVHTLTAVSPETPSPGVQTDFTSWSTGATTSEISYTVPSSNSKLTANFSTSFAVTLKANGSGSISAAPALPASGYYPAGTHVTITAVAAAGFAFTGFKYSGTTSQVNPLTLTLNGALAIEADFTALNVPITVAASSPLLSISVDGSPFTGSKTFSWIPGSSHKVDASLPAPPVGVKAQFSSWSDGLPIAHAYIVPAAATTVTAAFSVTYLLTSQAGPNGSLSLSPTAPSNYYAGGQQVRVTATPASGFTFGGFSGALSGTTNPQTLTVSQPATVGATFVKNVAVSFGSNVAGQPFTVTVDSVNVSSTSILSWTPGSKHTLSIPSPQVGGPNQQYVFSSWQGIGTANQINAAPLVDTLYDAVFTTQFRVSATVSPAGTGLVAGAGWYNSGSNAALVPSANGGYAFTGFSGVTGTANASSFVVTGPVTAVADFAPATATVNATLTVIADGNPAQVVLQALFRNLGKGTAGGTVIDTATITTASGANDVTLALPIVVGDIQGNSSVTVPLNVSWPVAENKITLTLHYTANGGVLQNSQKFNLFR